MRHPRDIVERAVEVHMGELSLESTEGEGSRFTVVLPARS